ncbi:MAG: hypothetical protein ACTHOD_17745 [Motilibacteraceae bacterium]
MSDDRLPIDRVLPGMGLHALPDGHTPLEAFVIITSLDREGEVSWAFRTTHVPNQQEILGALIEQSDVLRHRMVRQWDVDDEE